MNSRPRFICLLALVVALLAVTGSAQSIAGYSLFGLGCDGTGAGPNNNLCTLNPTAGSLVIQTLPNEYAYAVKAPVPMMVMGFQLYTAGVSGVAMTETALYLADTANPAQPAGTAAAMGMMPVGTKADFYTCILDKPVQVMKDQMFWISQLDTTNVRPCDLTTGATPPGSIYWRRLTSTSWAKTGILNYPAYKIILPGTGTGTGMPFLHNKGVPQLTKTFDVNLSYAKANSPAVMFFGATNTSWAGLTLPFDLGPFGATNCSIYSAGTLMASLVTGISGTAKLTYLIPPIKDLVGAKIHHQWLILDVKANNMGLVVSNAGTGTIQP